MYLCRPTLFFKNSFQKKASNAHNACPCCDKHVNPHKIARGSGELTSYLPLQYIHEAHLVHEL